MSEAGLSPRKIAQVQRVAREVLSDGGLPPAVIEALLAFDMSNFRWRRMAEKDDFKGKVIAEIGERLDPAILQGLIAAAQIAAGIGACAPRRPTVGMVAERMAVDPSRASRIVAELVERGFLIREADQEDARRTVLALTPKAKDYLDAFIAAKWRLLTRVFDGWQPREIRDFARLFGRYVDRLGAVLEMPAEG